MRESKGNKNLTDLSFDVVVAESLVKGLLLPSLTPY